MKCTFATVIVLSVSLLGSSGCSDGDEPVTTDMHEDFTHDHQHQHGAGDSHEHEHDDDFKGSHAHGHEHSHRHGKPLHGGRVLSVGHTHHQGGATHFHVELMPLTDDSIRFFLQTEDANGEAVDCCIEDREIEALISVRGMEAASREVCFTAVSDGENAEFVLPLPEDLISGEKFSVIVPKLTLGGQRQNFSFKIAREKTGQTASQTDDGTASAADSEQSGSPPAVQEAAGRE